MEELEDDEQFILEEERHRELISALNKVKDTIPQNLNTKSVEASLNELKSILSGISFSPKINVSSPEVNVDLSSIEYTMKCLIDEIKILNEKKAPKEWDFNIKRSNITGEILSVKATANG